MTQTKRPRPVQVSHAQQPETERSSASQPDLLAIHVWEMKQEERDVIAPSIAAMIVRDIADLSAMDLQTIARFVDLVKYDEGSVAAPAENFIAGLVNEHYERGGVTPDAVSAQLEPQNTDGFRCNFDEVLKSARRMCARYPDLVTEKPDKNYREVA